MKILRRFFKYILESGERTTNSLLRLRDKYEIPIKVYTPEHNAYISACFSKLQAFLNLHPANNVLPIHMRRESIK
jgi:hypothetical protein